LWSTLGAFVSLQHLASTAACSNLLLLRALITCRMFLSTSPCTAF
jgi:hypothetical protein